MAGSTAVTVEDLRAAKWGFASHMNCGSSGHHYTYTAPEFPEALVCKGWNKEGKSRRHYHVMQICMGPGRFEEAPIGDLEEAARLISKVRQHQVDEAEWAATEPDRCAHG